MAKPMFPHVLFFINGPTPTEQQVAEAAKLGPGVRFRNAQYVSNEGAIEHAHAVAGDPIPQRYRDALPLASDRGAVQERMSREGNDIPYDRLPKEAKDARNANDVARGTRHAPVNERREQPTSADDRTGQARPADLAAATDTSDVGRQNTSTAVGTVQQSGWGSEVDDKGQTSRETATAGNRTMQADIAKKTAEADEQLEPSKPAKPEPKADKK